ncbi:MAG: LD-carboxypeptidase [Candidatus Gastranaerophilales bacterium]|nr:LD-carboxypeptidase [Candidatus Gastranaerophilales bacterium]
MKIIKPKKLQKGDTILILAVSGKIKEIDRINSAKKFFENEGYNVVISHTCLKSHRYMAGENDEDCANALHSAFLDKNIDAIICARGGYGTLRLINLIDWNIIRNNPKIFAGYSDITVLLNMIFQKTGLITFHSAMPNGDFSQNIEEITKSSFFKTLCGKADSFKAVKPHVYKQGTANGRLWGGNLASLVSLCGTDFIPDDNLILLLEDLNEPVYKIDRMLTQLFNIDKLKNNVKGIAIGEFQNIENIELLDEMLTDFSNKINIPLIRGFQITHGKIKDTFPIAVMAELDTTNSSITIEESFLI